MSDEKRGRKRGGCLTFLMALAAVIMSSVSLYVDRDQLGEVTTKGRDMLAELEEKYHNLEAEFEEWRRERSGDELVDAVPSTAGDDSLGVDFGELRGDLRGALDALFAEENVEAARERIGAINEKIDDYLAHLRDDVAPEVKADLQSLKEQGARALESIDTNLEQTEDDVRAMFRAVKLLDQQSSGE